MKATSKYLKNCSLLTLFAMSLLLSSCGTYQSVYNQDGIYDDEIKEQVVEIAVIQDNNNQPYYQQNSFTNKLEELENIGENEVFVDVDSYSSDNSDYVDDETIDNTLNYNANASWGYDNSSAPIVTINVMNNPYWNGFNNWGYNDPWLYNNWGYRNWGMWGGNYWGMNSYWHPYNNGFGWNTGFVNPYSYNRPWGNNYNNQNRNVSYSRRDYKNNTNSRNTNDNSRFTSSLSRRSNTYNSSSTVRRSAGSDTSSNRRSSNSIIRTSRNNNNNNNTYQRSSNNSNTAERRSSTSNSNNSSNTSERRSSSSSSGTSSRSSSGRSSSTTSRKRGN